jgi:CRISPR/Cas system CSM-associated protein Csm3 (group 7 of RAMP superfamily)
MLKKLVNEVQLKVQLSTDEPLLICRSDLKEMVSMKSGICFVSSLHNGQYKVFMPGSIIKGIFRSRFEKIMEQYDQHICNIFDTEVTEFSRSCSGRIAFEKKKNHTLTAAECYEASCVACRLFGNLELDSRIQFTDAYPVSDPPIDAEVFESSMFEFKITLTNFARYQLAFIIMILEDIDAGMVSFGRGTSLGSGKLKFENRLDVPMDYHYYGNDLERFCGYAKSDVGKKITLKKQKLYQYYTCFGVGEILNVIDLDTALLADAMAMETWSKVRIHQRGSLKK